MTEMTARKPRRARRVAPSSLPRPTAGDGAARRDATVAAPAATPQAALSQSAQRRSAAPRQHHVTTDYSYVKRDLLLVAAVGAVVLGFIVAMSQVV